MEEINKNMIPAELKELRQWVCWKYELNKKGKPTKPLLNPRTRRKASHSNPNDWASYEEALDVYKDGLVDGIGFVFTEGDKYAGIDLEHRSKPSIPLSQANPST